MHIRSYSRLFLVMATVCVVAVTAPEPQAGQPVVLKFLGFEMEREEGLACCMILIALLAVAINSTMAQVHFFGKVYSNAASTFENKAIDGFWKKDIAHGLYLAGFTRVFPIVRFFMRCRCSQAKGVGLIGIALYVVLFVVAIGIVWVAPGLAISSIQPNVDWLPAMAQTAITWFTWIVLMWGLVREFCVLLGHIPELWEDVGKRRIED